MAKKQPMVVDPFAVAQPGETSWKEPGIMMSIKGQNRNAPATAATAFVRSNRDSSLGATFEAPGLFDQESKAAALEMNRDLMPQPYPTSPRVLAEREMLAQTGGVIQPNMAMARIGAMGPEIIERDRMVREAMADINYEQARNLQRRKELDERIRTTPKSIRQERELIRQDGGVVQPNKAMADLGRFGGEIAQREARFKAQYDLERFMDRDPKGVAKYFGGDSPDTIADNLTAIRAYSGGSQMTDADMDSIIFDGGYKAFKEFNETGRVPRNLDKQHPAVRRYIRDQWQKQNLEAIRSGKKLPYGQTGFLPNVAGDGSRSQFFFREDGSRIRPGDPEYADSIARAEAAGETVSRSAKIRNQRELERRAGQPGPAAANPAWETQGRMAADTPVRQRAATVKNIGGNVSGYTDDDAKAAGIRPGDVIRDPNGNAVMMTQSGLLPATIGPRGDYVVDQRMAGMIQMMEQDPGMYAQARDSLAQYQRNPNSVYHDSAIRLKRNSDELMRIREAIGSGNFDGNELRQLRRRERELQGNEVRIVQGYAERSGVLIGDEGEKTGELKWDSGAAVWTMKKANGDTEVVNVGMYPGVPDDEVHEEAIKIAMEKMSGFGKFGQKEIDESDVQVTQEDLLTAYERLRAKKAAESAARRAASEAIKRGSTQGGLFSDPESLLPGTEISPDLPPNVFYDSTGMLGTDGAHAGSVYIIDKATGRTKRVQISTFKTNQNVYMAAVQSGEVALVLPPGRSNLIENKPIDRAAGR